MEKTETSNKLYKELLDKEKEIKRNGMHSFHRYFGKLIPAIPAFAINNFSKEGDYILDSFSGSGTTVLEAKKLNRNAYGVDINPLAAFTARVKIQKIPSEKILETYRKIKSNFEKDKKDYLKSKEPYCVNIDHWFKPFVKKDLLKLRHQLITLPQSEIKDFFLGCFSAFLRGVSNADPQHVFPGYSKRLRKLDAENGREINVIDAFEKAVVKRAKYIDTLPKNNAKIKVFQGDSRKLPKEITKVKLVIVNPPYISSIRYLETMKIEMGWLGFITDQKEYLDLDKQIVGTERFYKKETDNIEETGITKLDSQIKRLKKNGQQKMAKVVAQYFGDMRKSISEMNRVLVKGGHLIFKISDSNVRKELIDTHSHFIQIAEELGLKKVAAFKDEFEKNSRSLLTSRNRYSGIMNHDWIIILKK